MSRILAALLLVGSALLIVCSAAHPILPLTGQGDLARIQATPYWHSIHVGLLYGTGLILAGIWCRWLGAEGTERAGLTVGFVVFSLGQVLNGVNIAYMTGAGTVFAELGRSGAPVAGLYEATHASAVMAGRLAGFLVALAAGLVAMTTARNPTEPRGLVAIAWIACGAGLIGNALAPPGHPIMLTSIGVMALWQGWTALRLLREA
jgi:hypothetical protein